MAMHGPRVLPATLTAPAAVQGWRMRLLLISAAFTILSIVAFVWTHEGRNHLLRAYLMAYMTCFNFAGGGLAMLMLQYVSGGKWGLIARRPLEAMSRTLWLVAAMFLPIGFLMKYLYQWARFPNAQATARAFGQGLMTKEQQLTANSKHGMLSPVSVWIQTAIIFGVLLLFTYLLNKWSLQRDADPAAGTEPSFNRWQIKFENLSGIGILIYVILMTVGAIDWIKSLDVTWYSSIWGLQFLVAQGFGVLALGILTVIRLSKFEPIKTLLRVTEQHDLGKLALAFVMLNIYLTFAEFLIIWSGNIPDEIPWYLNRIHGGWWYICSLDFICHWVIPFYVAAFARSEAKQDEDDLAVQLDDLCAMRRHVLADRAELSRCGRQPAYRRQHRHSRLHYGTDCGPELLGLVLPGPTADATSDQCERPSPRGDAGAGTCPLITTISGKTPSATQRLQPTAKRRFPATRRRTSMWAGSSCFSRVSPGFC